MTLKPRGSSGNSSISTVLRTRTSSTPRGALDMKGEGLLHLMTMILLKHEGAPLSRDVIFLGTADEEVNDEGSLWMIANKSDLFKNAEYLLTEGGDNLLENGE